ncbi:MAG: T9SS type A sorting domain-containing protein [Elusimicrobiota bacterium]
MIIFRRYLILFLGALSILLMAGAGVFAAGTPAGTVITNGGDGGTSAVIDTPGDTIVTRESTSGVTFLYPSNSVTTLISTGYAVSLIADVTSQTLTGGSTAFYSCIVTNSGNAPDLFTISVSTVSGEAWEVKIYRDENSDRVHQPQETSPVSQTGLLSPDASFYFLIDVYVPQPQSSNLVSKFALVIKDSNGAGFEDGWPSAGNDIIYSSFTTYLTAVSSGIKIIDSTGKDIELNGGIIKLFIEPNDIGKDVKLFYSTNPLSSPLLVSKSKIFEANYKDDENPLTNRVPDSIAEIALQDNSGAWLINNDFNSEVELRMSYKDADNDGYADNTSPPVYEKSLKIYVLNETRETWEAVSGSYADVMNNYVSANIKHFSVYILIGIPAPVDLSGVKVYPNPYKPGTGGAFDRTGGIVFDNVTENITIKIFNIAAELVFEELVINTGGQFEWKTNNNSGQPVASGVYIYYITNEKSQKKTGKFMIIR